MVGDGIAWAWAEANAIIVVLGWLCREALLDSVGWISRVKTSRPPLREPALVDLPQAGLAGVV
jgi:hypothetical protein